MLPPFMHVALKAWPHQTGRRVSGLSAIIISTDDCRALWGKHEQAAWLSLTNSYGELSSNIFLGYRVGVIYPPVMQSKKFPLSDLLNQF